MAGTCSIIPANIWELKKRKYKQTEEFKDTGKSIQQLADALQLQIIASAVDYDWFFFDDGHAGNFIQFSPD